MNDSFAIQKNDGVFVIHHNTPKLGFSSFFLDSETELKNSLNNFLTLDQWLPEGAENPHARLCAHPTMAESWLPTPDVQVAQLLALITDEREFVNRANIHSGRYPTHLAAA